MNTQSKPISTIVEELQTNLQIVGLAAQALKEATQNDPSWTNKHIETDYQYRVKLANLGASAEQNLGPLLEYIALLESEREWVVVGESLPEVPIRYTKDIEYSEVVSVQLEDGSQSLARRDYNEWWDVNAQNRVKGVIAWRELIP